jgi:hypothetical protein
MRTFQHICNSYCQHYSCSQKVHRTREIITPHTNVPFSPTLSHTLYSYNSHTFPAPSLHTAKSYNVSALWVLCITESHPFHHLMGQGPLRHICLHALAVHSPYSRGSISVPLLPLSTLEQVLPRRCHSTVSPSYGLVIIVSQESFRRSSGDVWPDTPSTCPSQKITVILLSACSTFFDSVPYHLGQLP